MRGLPIVVAAAFLAPAQAVTPVAKAVGQPVVAGDGLSVNGKQARFGVTPRAEAIALVRGVLGAPVEQGSHGDCGQDVVIDFARFRGDFELTFVRGKLAGWSADGGGVRTNRGITVGATLAATRKAYPDLETDPGDEANGGLGPSFQREGGPGGWLNGVKPSSKVMGLYAGATCIVS